MYRVMIVDDEPLILAGIASLLDWKEYGCEISGKAANGQQALKLMEEQKPDIVITDIKMPGMDGIGFMKAVKERGWDDVIFILLTNLEEFSLARQALSLGAVEYLVKMELTEEKLADSLKLAMERREMKRKAEAAGTAVTVSREDAVREYIEKLLTDGGTFSGGASSGNAGEASAQHQGEGYDSCLRRPVLAIISFNYGARKFRRVREAYLKAVLIATMISTLSFLCFQLIPRQIIGIFGSGSEEYFHFAEQYFRIFLFFTFLNGLQPITANYFTSIGKAAKGIFISLTRQIIFLLPLIVVLPMFLGIEGVMYSAPVADLMAALLALVFVTRELRRMRGMEEEMNCGAEMAD